MSAKFLAKRPDAKLLAVTIIHSSTTETVRLPGEGPGGGAAAAQPTIVHPAAARKLPFKRRVRLDRRRRKDGQGRNKTAPAPNTAPTAVATTPSAATPSAPPLRTQTSAPPAVSSGTEAGAIATALTNAISSRSKKAAKKVRSVACPREASHTPTLVQVSVE